MSRVIAIANQKGGVGKTTTAINLGAGLAVAERRTLVVDMDPQGNATSGMGLDRATLDGSVYDVLVDGAPSPTWWSRSTSRSSTSCRPARTSSARRWSSWTGPSRELVLRRRWRRCAGEYEFVLLDCPPSLGLLTLNTLAAADTVLIPIQCEFYALEGCRSC
jgi:chromosome partitioning protein